MGSNKDYYDYWNKGRSGEYILFDREVRAIKLIRQRVGDRNLKFLDLGCGHGEFMKALAKAVPNLKLTGLDFSSDEVREAKSKGLNVTQADFSKKVNGKDNEYDFCYGGEIIEHLYDPDFFLEEINRVTKKGGYVLITTPNLLSWFNRILFPLGVQPLFIEPSTRSKLVGAGILAGLKKEPQPVGHIRIQTIQSLKDMLVMNGFEVVKIQGAVYDAGLPRIIWPIDRIFAHLTPFCSHMMVLARKIK